MVGGRVSDVDLISTRGLLLYWAFLLLVAGALVYVPVLAVVLGARRVAQRRGARRPVARWGCGTLGCMALAVAAVTVWPAYVYAERILVATVGYMYSFRAQAALTAALAIGASLLILAPILLVNWDAAREVDG